MIDIGGRQIIKTPSETQSRAVGDIWLFNAVIVVAALGLVMMTSASIPVADTQFQQPFYYLYRQSGFLFIGLSLACAVWHIPLRIWKALGPVILVIGFLMLVMVLIPGVGRVVNGSARWLSLGGFNIQVSELMKLFLVIYMAGFLARHLQRVRSTVGGFLGPVIILFGVALFLLMEPDFGATVVLTVMVMGMLLFAGVQWWQLVLLKIILVSGLVVLAVLSPYRWQRIVSYVDPWADPFGWGFQLSNSLIAFGRGEWWGVGLGESIQKLFYLPEAHTDFVFAVLAEELGFFGVLVVIVLFGIITWRCFVIARAAEVAGRFFGAFLAYGIGVWLAFQAYVNMGVNMGVLPTKGLTLPLMSYGGSSVIVTCIAIALVLRVDKETRYFAKSKNHRKRMTKVAVADV